MRKQPHAMATSNKHKLNRAHVGGPRRGRDAPAVPTSPTSTATP
jgi:hypothetical protein